MVRFVTLRARPALARGLAALAVSAAPLAAQATFAGLVVDDSTRAPVMGAEVVIEGTGRRTFSDSAGRFLVVGLPQGVGYATVRKIGFRPMRYRTLVFGPDTLEVEVRLRPSIMELEPIEVTAAAVPPGMIAFAERRAAGEGRFIDWNELRASEARRVSDLLRGMSGVQLLPAGARGVVAATRRGRCPMAIWMDGARVFQPGTGARPPSIDDWPIAQLEAIEIYRGPAETPAELSGTGAGCGTIVLWTRRR